MVIYLKFSDSSYRFHLSFSKFSYHFLFDSSVSNEFLEPYKLII